MTNFTARIDQLKAIIFDFDGVLADTEPVHFRMFRQILFKEGIELILEDYEQRYIGLTDEACFRAVMRAGGRSVTADAVKRLASRKTTLMQEALSREAVVIPGVEDFLLAASRSYRLAIASGALRREIEVVLERAGLLSLFEHISSAEDVPQGKPQPDLYLHALDRLNAVEPLLASECLAIEDSGFGIAAAQGAGLRCLAVASSLDPLCLGEADAVVVRLDECDLSTLVRHFWPLSSTGSFPRLLSASP